MDNLEKLEQRRRDYESALLVQSAVNLSGVVFSFAEIMKRICEDSRNVNSSTDWKNNHAICRLFSEQIMFLTSGKDYFEAVEECEKYSKEYIEKT